MNFTHFFVDRPIFAAVVSILITLVGGVSYFALPVSQYPEIAPPTINISASYPGASAETIAKTVATPIELELNGVENMLYVVSQSTGDGRISINVVFKLGTDLDQAQVLVQNRVSAAEPRLPEAVRRLGVSTTKSSPDLMMVIHVLSPDDSRDLLYVSNYARTQIVDRLARIDGVGQARLFAERAYSMRVWLDPALVAARNLTAGEVVAALRENNVQVASGVIDRLPVPDQGAVELPVETEGRLIDPAEFEDIVVATGEDGQLIRVRDIGRVELGSQDYSTNGYLGSQAALPIVIFQRPGSNALDTAAELKATMAEMAKSFPDGVGYEIIYDPTVFIAESVDAVYITIFEAVLLVVLVIVIFLQSLRASLVPIMAIPISLIGTFAVLAALGFSLNTLTLFGLVLAIGIVVDDAIIVVENVERYLREGYSPNEAAHKTMDEVSGALIASGLVLTAVFLPAAFIEGISGQFFRQFAVTITVATLISVIVSLTLSPAMCALLLRHKNGEQPAGFWGRLSALAAAPFDAFGRVFNWGFDKAADGYAWIIRRLIRVSALVLIVYVGLVALTGFQFQRTPTGFIPDQDQGYLITVLQLPAGASLSRTDAVVRRVNEIIQKHPAVRNTVSFAGLDGATFTNASNGGTIFVPLKPHRERTAAGYPAGRVLGELNGALQQIKEARIFVVAPPPVRGVGSTGGWKLYIQDRRGRGLEALEQATMSVVGASYAPPPEGQSPQVTQVFSLFNTATPKIYADIDRVKAQIIGVTPSAIFETLEVYLGSAFVNDFNFLGRTYRVTAQADGQFRDEPRDIAELRARSQSGEMTPIGAVAELKDITGPYRVARYNLYDSAAIQGSNAPGVSTGQAIAHVEALLAKVLPDGFGYEWTELALQEKQAGNTAIIAFFLAVICVFLVLAAQYESLLLPLSIILIVPMSLLSAVTGVMLRGFDNNILVQIGFVVLVALAAKNAILIVEFAKQGEDEGKTRVEAAIEAARLRLRPILMTALAFILGVVPLMIATGPGAEMRQALGTAVFSGMLGVTLFGLFLTPVFYVACRWLGSLRGEKAATVAKPAN